MFGTGCGELLGKDPLSAIADVAQGFMAASPQQVERGGTSSGDTFEDDISLLQRRRSRRRRGDESRDRQQQSRGDETTVGAAEKAETVAEATLRKRRERQRESSDVLVDVLFMHGLALVLFSLLWIPSAYTRYSNCGGGSTWSFVTCALLCSSVAWGVDIVMVRYLPKLGACLAMYQTLQFQYSLAYVCHASHNAPLFLPGVVGVLLHACMAAELFYITHASHGPLASFGSADFYMGHVWGFFVAEAVRAVLLRPVLFVMLGDAMRMPSYRRKLR